MTSIITRSTGDPPPIRFLDQPIIPGSDDGNFRSMVVVNPFTDPINTFRAQTVEDMFFIVPDRREFSQFVFNVGLDPKIEPLIFSIQNKTVNVSLRVTLTLPSYLRSSLGMEFLVPAIGDTTTPPVLLPSLAEREGKIDSVGAPPSTFEGTGKGLINVTMSFNEGQAKTFNPGNIIDEIVFDIFPNEELTGPVFVSTEIVPPNDLNVEEGDFPVDDDQPTGSIEPEVVTITEFVTTSVEIPVPTPAFIAGADGITNEGISFTAGDQVPGPPPAGWVTEADGRAYPPIIPPMECDIFGGSEDDVSDDELTPLQLLVRNVQGIPPSFGAVTKRRGFVVDAKGQLTGNDPGRVSRRTVELVVADSVPGKEEFTIVGRSLTFVDETPILSDSLTRDYFDTVNLMVSLIKEGQVAPFSIFRPGTFRNNALSRTIKTAFDSNDDLAIPITLNSAELQNFRIAATALGLLRELRQNGPGVSKPS